MPRVATQKNTRIFAFIPANGAARRYRERPAKTYDSEEIRFAEELQEVAATIVDDDGKPATPEIGRWARGDGKPLSIWAGYVKRAAKHGASPEPFYAMLDRARAYVDRIFRKYGHRGQRAA